MANKPNIGATITLDGEKEYRQAIDNVNTSQSVLRSELKAVSAEFYGNANSIDALNAKNSTLAKHQTEQEKKLQILRGALIDANKQYGESSDKAQEWQRQLNYAYSDLEKLNRELKTNEKYLDQAKASTNGTAKSIDAYGKEVKAAKKETSTFGEVLKANLTGTAIIAGVQALASSAKNTGKAIVNLVKDTAAYADNMLTMSTQTGIGTDKLQAYNYMAELTDTSLEDMTKTMAKNIKSMSSAQKGTVDYVEAYKRLGVEIKDGNGNLLDSEEVYWKSIDALGKMTNETERDALSMKLFGKSAQDLNPLIAIGTAGVAKFTEEAKNMGAILSNDTLKSLGETDDALQRFYQQLDIAKRNVGIELAPAMVEGLEKVSEKISETSDEFADFAGGALENVVDAFIWMVDNADLIAAGLKGITAALIAKKAADGIEYAAAAYRTLTTATQAATVATVGLNTVTKASVIGAIASLVIGAGTAIYSYAKSADEAAEEVSKLTAKTQELIDKSKELREGIEDRTKDWDEETESIEAQYGALSILSDRLYELADKEDKTNSEKQQMISLVNQLNEKLPELNLSINEQTGLLSLQSGAVDKLIDSQKELYLIQAAEKNYTEIAEARSTAEIRLNELIEERINKNLRLQQLQYNLANLGVSEGETVSAFDKDKIAIDSANKSMKTTRADLTAIDEEMRILNNTISASDKQWESNDKYISKLSASMNGATNQVTDFTEKYAAALEEQNKAQEASLDDRIDLVQEVYEQSEKELDKSIKAEQKALEKAQKAKTKLIEDASKKEIEDAEKTLERKKALYAADYAAKKTAKDVLHAIEIGAVQSEIDDIIAQSEAEDRAAKLKEEVNKRAELELQIASAETTEDKLQAQADLVEFEEETAKERLKEERDLQIDILEEKKDGINDAYDAEIDVLEKEKTAKELKATEEYEAEKVDIQSRLTLKLEELAEKQELETTALEDSQAGYKTYLADQKELALANAKEIYAADLAEFKINNALKYNEVTASEDQMKLAIKNHMTNDLGVNVWEANQIYKTKSLDEMMQYYNPSTSSTSPQATINIDYSLIKDAMKSAVKEVTLKLNEKVIGKIVEDTVNKMIR